MAGLLGMDVDAVRAVATKLDLQTDVLRQIIATVDQLSGHATATWHGPDAQDFHGQWHGQHRPALQQTAGALADLAQILTRNAAEQEHTSRPGAVPTPAGLSSTAGLTFDAAAPVAVQGILNGVEGTDQLLTLGSLITSGGALGAKLHFSSLADLRRDLTVLGTAQKAVEDSPVGRLQEYQVAGKIGLGHIFGAISLGANAGSALAEWQDGDRGQAVLHGIHAGLNVAEMVPIPQVRLIATGVDLSLTAGEWVVDHHEQIGQVASSVAHYTADLADQGERAVQDVERRAGEFIAGASHWFGN